MRQFQRVFLIVLDSLGIGEMKDSHDFGDVGVDTFGHIWQAAGPLHIPHLARLGLLDLHPVEGRAGTPGWRRPAGAKTP